METYSVNQINKDVLLQSYLKHLIFSEIQKVGFELFGVAKVTSIDEAIFLREWISKNYHADMDWFSKTIHLRTDVKKWFSEGISIIAVGENYYHKCENTFLALYAHGTDYHIRIRKKLNQVASFLNEFVTDMKFKISVDTSPVYEKYWAKKAGLGWQGKNTLIINPKYGSWFNIGLLVVNFALPEDVEVKNQCGNCNNCIDACPTKALSSPGILDVRKCISYHTIENKKNIPKEIRISNKSYVFGCDICQLACPWNRNTPISSVADICDEKIYSTIKELLLSSGNITDFSVFKYSPIRRLGSDLLLRNASFLMQKLEK